MQYPPGVVDEVNYGGSVKAFLFLLNNDCCTSIDKSRKFLSDLTDGRFNISKGMVNKLSKEFAKKTEQERKTMFADLPLPPSFIRIVPMQGKTGKMPMYLCALPRMEKRCILHAGKKGTKE